MADSIAFTTVGWTDVGQGFRQERESAATVSDQYWTLAKEQLQFVPQPPESLQDLEGVPVWSLSSVSGNRDPMWCFTVQSRGDGHRAGTVQMAFADGRLPASAVWRGAAQLIADRTRGLPDRLPWVKSTVTVEAVVSAVPPDAAEFQTAAAELLTFLVGSPGLTIVPAGPETMAELLPAVLALLPKEFSRQLRWHTCLLQTAKSARASWTTVMGLWSPFMRRSATSAAAEVDAWLEVMRRTRPRPVLPAGVGELVAEIVKGLATGHAADPDDAERAGSVLGALERTAAAWKRPGIDVAQLVADRAWRKLVDNPNDVVHFGSAFPRDAAKLFVGWMDPAVAGLLVRGLANHLASDTVVADRIGFPSKDSQQPADYLRWLGGILCSNLGEDWCESQIVAALTAPGERWDSNRAKTNCAALFHAMVLSADRRPDLYPFDAAGIADDLDRTRTVSDDVAEQIAGAADPIDAVRSVAAAMPLNSSRLFGELLGAALRSPRRYPGWGDALTDLVTEWVEHEETVAHRPQSIGTRQDPASPPEWWANMIKYADRVTTHRSDRTILVDAGLAVLLRHRYPAGEILLATRKKKSSTLDTHLSDVQKLTQPTAEFIAQLVPAWDDEHRLVAQRDSELERLRRQAASASGWPGSVVDDPGSVDDQPHPAAGHGHPHSAAAASQEPLARKRWSGLLTPLRRENVAGPAVIVGMLALVVVMVVAVVLWAAGGSDDTAGRTEFAISAAIPHDKSLEFTITATDRPKTIRVVVIQNNREAKTSLVTGNDKGRYRGKVTFAQKVSEFSVDVLVLDPAIAPTEEKSLKAAAKNKAEWVPISVDTARQAQKYYLDTLP